MAKIQKDGRVRFSLALPLSVSQNLELSCRTKRGGRKLTKYIVEAIKDKLRAEGLDPDKEIASIDLKYKGGGSERFIPIE